MISLHASVAQSYILGQNKWNIWTTPIPFLWCQNGVFLLLDTFIIAFGGKGVNCSFLFFPRLQQSYSGQATISSSPSSCHRYRHCHKSLSLSSASSLTSSSSSSVIVTSVLIKQTTGIAGILDYPIPTPGGKIASPYWQGSAMMLHMNLSVVHTLVYLSLFQLFSSGNLAMSGRKETS